MHKTTNKSKNQYAKISLLFYAQASRHLSHEFYHNPLEFYKYYLIYYVGKSFMDHVKFALPQKLVYAILWNVGFMIYLMQIKN